MDKRGAGTQNLIPVNPLVIAVFVLVCFNFFAFRWFGSQDKAKSSAAIEGLLRREYATANSYALSKALTDLESLGLIRCVVLTEELGTGRTFYDTSNGSSCVAASPFHRLFIQESDLQAVNGLVYHLMYQLPLRWQSLLLEVMTYLLIATLALLYHRHMRAQQLKQAISDALVNQSRQVSHDIRSPLSALNMVVKRLEGVPEDQRRLIQAASERINGIANDLLQRHRGNPVLHSTAQLKNMNAQTLTKKPIVIADLLRSIFAEKKVALIERDSVQLKLDLTGPVDALCEVDEKELSRVLSNLINNAVESLDEGGEVTLALRSSLKKDFAIIVSDNGKGIPEDVLAILGKEKISHGKDGTESGAGIGVFHARSVIEAMGGKFLIQSRVRVGTIITITLPRSEPLDVSNGQPEY